MKDLLIKLNACQEAQEWAADKTWEEVYSTCERGDWLLWLFFKTNPDDLQILTLAKGHIANTVRHLMKDDRSIKAVDVAIAFGEGKATREELQNAAYASTSAAYDAYASTSAAYAAAASAASATSAAYASTSAAYAAAASAYDAASDAYATSARKDSFKQSADIVRKYIPIELWNIN